MSDSRHALVVIVTGPHSPAGEWREEAVLPGGPALWVAVSCVIRALLQRLRANRRPRLGLASTGGAGRGPEPAVPNAAACAVAEVSGMPAGQQCSQDGVNMIHTQNA